MNTRLGALVLGFGFLWSDLACYTAGVALGVALEGIAARVLVHLGNLAYWHRRELRWDPAKWSFVDDAEANTWRDRERRDPWQLPKV